MPKKKPTVQEVTLLHTIGSNLRRYRLATTRPEGDGPITQEDVARALRRTVTQVSRWERGVFEIGAVELYVVAKLYKVPVERFYQLAPGDKKRLPMQRSASSTA